MTKRKRDETAASKSNNQASSESSGPRKRNIASPPDFSYAILAWASLWNWLIPRDPNSLVTFLVIENEDGVGEGAEKKETKFTVHKEVRSDMNLYHPLSFAMSSMLFCWCWLWPSQVACYHSPILNTAFNSGFVEGQTQTYRLEDTTSRAFKLFVQWLYFEKLREDQFDGYTERNGEDQSVLDGALVEVWVLAEKFSVPLLQNAALKRINQLLYERSKSIATDYLEYIVENTAQDSLLRKYFIEIIGSTVKPSAFEAQAVDFPREILAQLVVYLANIRKDKAIALSNYLVPTDEKVKDGSSWDQSHRMKKETKSVMANKLPFRLNLCRSFDFVFSFLLNPAAQIFLMQYHVLKIAFEYWLARIHHSPDFNASCRRGFRLLTPNVNRQPVDLTTNLPSTLINFGLSSTTIMADSTSLSRKGNKCTIPQSEGPRKKHMPLPLEFS